MPETEMGKLSFHICGVCGAAVPFDADLPRPQEAERMHRAWHDQLEASLRQLRLSTPEGMLDELSRDPQVGDFVRKIIGT